MELSKTKTNKSKITKFKRLIISYNYRASRWKTKGLLRTIHFCRRPFPVYNHPTMKKINWCNSNNPKSIKTRFSSSSLSTLWII